jgi:predicted nucleic acid-binding protein
VLARSTATLCMNILVYALDGRAGDRHVLARHIINKAVLADCWLTLQSISEFYAAVTRKRLISPTEAADQTRDWIEMFRTAPASASAISAALTSASSGIASYWDALLVATAAEAGCGTIMTEDLRDGGHLHGVRIVNPFAGAALTPAAEALLNNA